MMNAETRRIRPSSGLTIVLTILLFPMAMAPGCIPGTAELPFTRFDYQFQWFGCEPSNLVATASIYRLDNGWNVIDMSVYDYSLIPIFCTPPRSSPCALQTTHALPTRFLSDAEVQQITDLFASLDIITGVGDPTPCAVDSCTHTSYDWDDQHFTSADGDCGQGEFTALTSESQMAIKALLEGFR